jgi:hypothetical protein
MSGATLAFLAAPLATEAQPAGKVWKLGYLDRERRFVASPMWTDLSKGFTISVGSRAETS